MTQDDLVTALVVVIADAHDELRLRHAAVIARAVVDYLAARRDCVAALRDDTMRERVMSKE